jgi:hypothetical protein
VGGRRGVRAYLEEEVVADGGEVGVGLGGERRVHGGEIHRRRRRWPAVGDGRRRVLASAIRGIGAGSSGFWFPGRIPSI